MTYEEYINNPLQTRLGGYTREIYRTSYTDRWNKIMVRENNDVEYHLYKAKDGSYYFYVKIPSEVVKKFTYDVIIRFKRPAKNSHNVDMDSDLTKYDVEFFSNDPAFVFNLEYTFKSKDMFVNDLKSKADPVALKNKPEITNPNNQLVYCKSIYFAYLFAKQRGLFVKSKYLDEYNKQKLLDQVEDSQIKIQKRQELGSKAEAEKKQQKKIDQVRKVIGKNKGPNFQVKNPVFKNMNNMSSKASGGGKKLNFNKSKKV